jgi:hypothetical protein
LTADAIRSPLQLIDLGLQVRTERLAATGREMKVTVRVDPAQMMFQHNGDRWTDGVEVVWVGLSPDGRVLERDMDRIELHPEQSGYNEIQHDGLSFTEHIRLGNDATELRLIVRDHGTGAIGSVNIPLAPIFANGEGHSSAN